MSTPLEVHDVVVVLGKRRSGKSYCAKQLLGEEMAAGMRVVCFDPHDEYSQKGRTTKATNLGPLRDRVTMRQLEDKPSLLDAKNLSLSVVPDSEQLGRDAQQFVRLVKHTGDLTICFDEVGEYVDEASRSLNEAATQSRHWGDEGCPVIFVAQRAVGIPKSSRNQVSILYTGIQSDPDDLALLIKLTGNPEFAEQVSRLPRPGLLEWRDSESPK